MVYGMERYGFGLYYPSRRAEWARSQVQPLESMIHHPPQAPSSAFNQWLALRAFAGDSLSVVGLAAGYNHLFPEWFKGCCKRSNEVIISSVS